MIDINELRRLAQAATQHVGRACNYQDAHSPREGHVDFENADLFIASERPEEDAAFYAAANPAAISELLDRLEAAEKSRDWHAERCEDAMNECDALRARIELLEQQEPVKHEFQGRDGVWYPFIDQRHHENTVADGSWPVRALYALPGAKGEEK